MWLNKEKISDRAINTYRHSLVSSSPSHIVIDDLFCTAKLLEVVNTLEEGKNWQTQKHTYSALYVDDTQWECAELEERFVQRDVWLRTRNKNAADAFLTFLRGEIFLALLSRIFNVEITDINVEDPMVNSNYFRLSKNDFVEQHADDSPGREICMLLYLNTKQLDKGGDTFEGGELVFKGSGVKLDRKQIPQPIIIEPLFNRCVLFDPSSNGAEHWVNKLQSNSEQAYRYNVTSWYWSE